MTGSEHTFSALSIRALTTAVLAKIGWLELKSKNLSVCVGFLYAETDISFHSHVRQCNKIIEDPNMIQ